MSFVLATADFPELEKDALDAIYTCLKNRNWIRLDERTSIHNTLWFNETPSAAREEAIKTASNNFNSCCIPYCIPRLQLEWGAGDYQSGPLSSF
jgi:hypothetical protein